jgi:hypothetical protein
MDIQDYIAELERQHEAARQTKAEKEVEEAAARKSARIAEWEKFNTAIPALLPEIIRPYFNPQFPEDSGVSSHRQAVHIDVPDCTTIRMFVKPTEAGYELVTNERDYGIEVATYELKYSYNTRDEEELHVRLDRYVRVSSLDDTLLVSHQAYREKLELDEKEDQQRQSRAQFLAERAERELQQEEQARIVEQRATEEKEIETLERNSIFGQLASDPVAFALVKVFVSLQNERSDYLSQIESLSEHAGSLEAWHSERITKLERSLNDAHRDAENYRREKDNLETDLDRTQRDIKKLKHQLA